VSRLISERGEAQGEGVEEGTRGGGGGGGLACLCCYGVSVFYHTYTHTFVESSTEKECTYPMCCRLLLVASAKNRI
jgi:hypothetical protein